MEIKEMQKLGLFEQRQPKDTLLEEAKNNSMNRSNINIRVSKVLLNFVNEFKSKIQDDFFAKYGRKMTQNDALIQAIFFYDFGPEQYGETFFKTVGEEVARLNALEDGHKDKPAPEKLAKPTVDPKNPETFNNKPESFGVTLESMGLGVEEESEY